MAQLGGLPAERVRTLYANMSLAVLAEALAVVALAIAVADHVPERSLWSWLAFMAGMAFVRLALAIQFKPYTLMAGGALAGSVPIVPRRWETMLLVATLAAGIGWGMSVVAFGSGASGVLMGGHILLIAVVTVIAGEALAASRRAMLAFALPALGIPALMLLLRGTTVGIAAAALVAAFGAGLLALFARRHDQLVAVLSARVQNERLLADLANADRTLREAQRDEQLVFDSALVGLAIVREGRIVRCNRKLEEVFAYRRGTLQGASTKLLYRNESEWREALEYVDLDFANSGEHDAEREFFRRDGTAIWCRYRGQVLEPGDPSRGAIWVFEDLSDAKQAAEEILRGEEQLAASDAEMRSVSVRLSDAIECVPDAFALFDRYDRLVNCNKFYVDTFPGNPHREELLGQTYEALVMRAVESGAPVPVDYKKALPRWVAELMRRHRAAGGSDFDYQTADGQWMRLRERRTSEGGIVALRTDITDQKRVEEQVRHLANHDPLTGLPNRRLLEDRMTQACNMARRSGAQVGVMLVDLDRFKIINDTKGHEVGDQVLREVAERLKQSVRQTDTVARQGGDEFVVVLTELKRPQDAPRVAQKIITAMSKPIVIGRDIHEVGASIGIAVFPTDGKDPEALLKQADAAMYRAKAAGRGRFEFVMQGPVQSELPY